MNLKNCGPLSDLSELGLVVFFVSFQRGWHLLSHRGAWCPTTVQTCLCCSREAMIEAGWELYDHLHSLGESVKDSKATSDIGNCGIANMTSVADQRARFSALTKSYVEHAAEYIGVELNNKTTHFMQTELIGRDSDGRIRIQDHSQLHQDIENLTTLVHVSHSLWSPPART